MQEDQPNFKVTDRRLFNADGSPRDLPPEEKPEPIVAATQEATAPAAPAREPEATPAEPEVPPAAAAEAAPEDDEEFSEEDLAAAREFQFEAKCGNGATEIPPPPLAPGLQ